MRMRGGGEAYTLADALLDDEFRELIRRGNLAVESPDRGMCASTPAAN